MNKLTTIQKGNQLEDRVYQLLENLIEQEEFYGNSKFCQLYKKKAYYSKDRDSDIITDVSIEVVLPNATKYTQLYIFECKNYGDTVSVDNIEEFSSKLSQIAGHNVKGIMITTSRYSEPGIRFANARGIGLARISDQDTLMYDINRKEVFGNPYNQRANILANLVQPRSLNSGEQYFICNDFTHSNIWSFFKQIGLIDLTPNKQLIPYISTENLSAKVNGLLERYTPEVFKLIQPTPLRTIYQRLESENNTKFIFNKELDKVNGNQILGKIEFDPLCVYVSKNLVENSPRWRFTLAHEIGHLLLHREILSLRYKEGFDTENSLDYYITDNYYKRIEIQANYFASCLILPELPFKNLVEQVFFYNNIHKVLRVDYSARSYKVYDILMKNACRYFQASESSIKYRLLGLGYLEQKNSYGSIREILNNQ